MMLVTTSAADEAWRDIPGWEGFYQASNLGNVRSLDRRVSCARGGRPHVRMRRGKVLRTITSNGYKLVRLSRDGEAETCGVHRLVCMAFHGAPPTKAHETAHFDGSRDNNVPSNLRWATPSENLLDRRRHGTAWRGPKTIDADTAAQIKARLRAGEMQKDISAALGLKRGIVGHIARGNAWAHID